MLRVAINAMCVLQLVATHVVTDTTLYRDYHDKQPPERLSLAIPNTPPLLLSYSSPLSLFSLSLFSPSSSPARRTALTATPAERPLSVGCDGGIMGFALAVCFLTLTFLFRGQSAQQFQLVIYCVTQLLKDKDKDAPKPAPDFALRQLVQSIPAGLSKYSPVQGVLQYYDKQLLQAKIRLSEHPVAAESDPVRAGRAEIAIQWSDPSSSISLASTTRPPPSDSSHQPLNTISPAWLSSIRDPPPHPALPSDPSPPTRQYATPSNQPEENKSTPATPLTSALRARPEAGPTAAPAAASSASTAATDPNTIDPVRKFGSDEDRQVFKLCCSEILATYQFALDFRAGLGTTVLGLVIGVIIGIIVAYVPTADHRDCTVSFSGSCTASF